MFWNLLYLLYVLWVQNVVSLSKQLEYYKNCQNELMKTVGKSKALSIISGALYLVADGVDDFILNYYGNLLLKVYTVDQFSDFLTRCYSNFIQACLSKP